MTYIVYGIPNCDTVKRARSWLDAKGLAYVFHDYKKVGVDAALLRDWVEQVGWEPLLNRAGMTFRKLPDADKLAIDADKAVALMVAQPSLIKRPVVSGGPQLLVGFKADVWEAALG